MSSIGKCKYCPWYSYSPRLQEGYCDKHDFHPDPNETHECCDTEDSGQESEEQ